MSDEQFKVRLLERTNNTPMAKQDYKDIFKCLSKDKQEKLMAKRECFAEKAGTGIQKNRKEQRQMQITTVMGKCINILKKWKQKILFKRKLREMDNMWLFMGGSCWGLFPPSFYYTHTEEEIEQISNETFEGIRKLIDELYH